MAYKSPFFNAKYCVILYSLFLLTIPSIVLSSEPEETQEQKSVEIDRAQFLIERAPIFHLNIFYEGPWSNYYGMLTLYVPSKNSTDSRRIERLLPEGRVEIAQQITQDEALKIIEYLRDANFLRGDLSAQTAFDPNRGQPDAQYVMEFGSQILKSGENPFYKNLGWGLPMLKRLEDLRRVFPTEARTAMNWLLERPRSYKRHWEFVEGQHFVHREYIDIRWPSPILGKPGIWKSGDWTYIIDDRVDDQQERLITVKYKGQPIVGEKPGDYLGTPWGVMMFYNARTGWIPRQGLFGLTTGDFLRDITPDESLPIKIASPASSEKEMIADLIEFIVTTKDLQSCTEAISDLGGLGPDAYDAVPYLVEIFRTAGSPSVRQITASALGSIGAKAEKAVPILMMALKDGGVLCDGGVLREAVVALGNIGPGAKDAVPALIGLLKDKFVRSDAAYSLGKIGPAAETAIPALIELLKDKYGSERTAAAWALARVCPRARDAIPALYKALKDEDEKIRRAAKMTLEMIEAAKMAQQDAPADADKPRR